MRATGAAVQLSYSVPLLAVPAVSESTPVTESDVMLCYVMLSLLPCERRTRVHTAADSVGGAMTAIASLPAPGDVDGTLLELEYRKPLEMFTRRQDANCVNLLCGGCPHPHFACSQADRSTDSTVLYWYCMW